MGGEKQGEKAEIHMNATQEPWILALSSRLYQTFYSFLLSFTWERGPTLFLQRQVLIFHDFTQASIQIKGLQQNTPLV